MPKTNMLVIPYFVFLGTVSTVSLVGIFFQLDAALSNDAQRSQSAKFQNACITEIMNLPLDQIPNILDRSGLAGAVRYCNGG